MGINTILYNRFILLLGYLIISNFIYIQSVDYLAGYKPDSTLPDRPLLCGAGAGAETRLYRWAALLAGSLLRLAAGDHGGFRGFVDGRGRKR
jgi:hypothetical protein